MQKISGYLCCRLKKGDWATRQYHWQNVCLVNGITILVIALFAFLSPPINALCATPREVELEPTIIVRADQSYPPYEFLDNGRPSGFNIDLIRSIADIMGLKIKIDLGPWNEVRENLERGKIDALADMYYSVERQEATEAGPAESCK